jgi:hypothetical protein
VARKNLIDDTSEVVTPDTPGVTLDLRNRTTLGRPQIPVRLKVFATNTIAGDTGVVVLLDSTGAAKVSVLITGGGSSNLDTHGAWYVSDGFLPATLAKYDLHYGDNTLGNLYVKDWSLYELADIGPNEGVLSQNIGDFALVAAGEVFHDAQLSQSIGDFGLVAEGVAFSPPTFQAAGAYVDSVSTISPAWPAHAIGDVALLLVESANEAVTLSSAQGFVEIPSSPQGTGTGGGSAATRLAAFWCRASSTSMAAPTVADAGDHVGGVILTFRGCVATGDPWDVTAGDVEASATTAVVVPSVTTTVPGTLLVAAVANGREVALAQFSSWTNANLVSISEIHDAFDQDGNGGGIGAACGVMTSAGATGTTTATLAVAFAQGRIAIALKAV